MAVTKEQETIASSRKTLSAVKDAWLLQKEFYAAGHRWKAEGKPVAWSCALFPKELYWSSGIYPFFPEQFAALFSVRRVGGSRDPNVPTYATKFCQVAEAEGYPDYLCGYGRTGLGYVLNGLRTGEWTDVPLGGPPLPDFLVTTSYGCDLRMKWFEAMAQMLKVPLFTLDAPEIPGDVIADPYGLRAPALSVKKMTEREVVRGSIEPPIVSAASDYEVDYMISQFEDYYNFAESVTGIKRDMDKLEEALDLSYRTCEVNREINELRRAVPAPMPSTDGFASAFPRLYLMGTKAGHDYFVKLRDELKVKVAAGEGAIPNEKFRLSWFGIPLWFNMGIFNYFEHFGGVFVYEGANNTGLLRPRRPEAPLKELALKSIAGGGIGASVTSIIEESRQFKIDGVVLAFLITCRPAVFPAVEMSKALERELGIPTVRLEADLVDERIFAQSQAFTRLDAFAEALLQKGSIAHGKSAAA
ncbi:2-hydroxyacyl-CoA dehydratase subunit D [Thermodesulfobacteriota bacterium]